METLLLLGMRVFIIGTVTIFAIAGVVAVFNAVRSWRKKE